MFVALACTGLVFAAGSATNNLGVQATVAASCRISSVTDINFGAYDPTVATNTDAAGDMVFRCVKSTNYKTFISGARSLTGTGGTLTFELYSDSNRTAAYPTDNSGSATQAGSNAPVTKNVYGRIAALQDAGVGADYAATLTATVEY